jgi:carbamoylphosphate synthase large subunit
VRRFKCQIDAVLPTMGGQAALNLCLEADEKEFGKILE